MSETEDGLVPRRKCGECSACCITLRIEDAALKKYADVACPNLRPEGGSGIYSRRPDVCRNWYCGWRLMKHLDDSWRPDRSEIIRRLHSSAEDRLVIQPISSAIRPPLGSLQNDEIKPSSWATQSSSVPHSSLTQMDRAPSIARARAYARRVT